MKNFQACSHTEADSDRFGIKPRTICPYQSLITWTGSDLVRTLGFVATGAQILLAQDVAAEHLCHCLAQQLTSGGCFTWGFLCIFFSFQRMQSISIPSTRVNDIYFIFLFYINVVKDYFGQHQQLLNPVSDYRNVRLAFPPLQKI